MFAIIEYNTIVYVVNSLFYNEQLTTVIHADVSALKLKTAKFECLEASSIARKEAFAFE